MSQQEPGQRQRPANPTVPRSEAEKKIDIQIAQGRRMLRPRVEDLGNLHKAERKWSEFNHEMLCRMFDNDSIADEYGWVGTSAALGSLNLGEQIREKIAKLESIRDRLSLMTGPSSNKKDGISSRRPRQLSRRVFVAHGRDDAAREQVAALLRKLDLQPVILQDLPNRSMAIIEKIEEYSDVAFAIVLLTPDDVGYLKGEPEKAAPRARENVILELGFFLALLGRSNVCPLCKGDVKIPTDYQGVLLVPMDAGGGWKLKLAQEIEAAEIEINLNKLVG